MRDLESRLLEVIKYRQLMRCSERGRLDVNEASAQWRRR